MSEQTTETTTTDPQTEPTPDTGAPANDAADPKSWREQPGAKAVFNQLKEANERLAQIENEKKAAEEKAEQERLAEQGRWEELAANEKAKREALEAAHAAQLTTMRLDSELIKSGLTEDFTRKGVIASYTGDADTVSEFVAKFKADNPKLFTAPGIGPAGAPAQGGKSGGSSMSLEERLKMGDPAAQREAFEKLTNPS